MARLIRFLLEILSQAHDEVVHGPGFHLRMISPDFFQELAAGEHAIGLRCQSFEQVGLQGRKLQLAARALRR